MFITLTETPEATQARLKAEACRGIQSESRYASWLYSNNLLFNPRCCLYLQSCMPIMSIYRLPLRQYEYAGHMSSTCHKMWCHLHNIFQQSWMRRLRHPSYASVRMRKRYTVVCLCVCVCRLFQLLKDQWSCSGFPGVSDTIFEATQSRKEEDWNNVRRQIDIDKNHLRYGAMIMNEPSLT